MSDTEKDNFDFFKLKQSDAVKLAKETTDVNVIIELSKHPNPYVRKMALREMCPCRVKEDIDLFWKRVIEMITDDDETVRSQVSLLLKQNEWTALQIIILYR